MKPHKARILAMQAIFQAEILHDRPQLFFQKNLQDYLLEYRWIDYEIPPEDRTLSTAIIIGVLKNLEEIDNLIKKYSTNWDFSRISNVNKAILRISFFQLLTPELNVPPKVVIDEAIKLSKEFAEDDSKRFINGILDKFYKSSLKN